MEGMEWLWNILDPWWLVSHCDHWTVVAGWWGPLWLCWWGTLWGLQGCGIGVSCSLWSVSCFVDILCTLWCIAWSMCSFLATNTILLLRWSYCLFLDALLWVSHDTVTKHCILAVGLRVPPICCLWHILQGAFWLPECCTILSSLFMLFLMLPALGFRLCWDLWLLCWWKVFLGWDFARDVLEDKVKVLQVWEPPHYSSVDFLQQFPMK